MPPTKTAAARKSSVSSKSENIVKTMNTRNTRVSTNSTLKKENAKDVVHFPKRKAVSPIKSNNTLKRPALGNITNAIEAQCIITSGKNLVKKITSSTVTKPTIATAAKVTLPATTKPLTVCPLSPNPHSGMAKKSVGVRSPYPHSKSMLPPLPKSRLTMPSKVNITTATQPKPRLSGTNLRSVPITNAKPKATAEKPMSRTVTKQSPVAKKPASAVVPASKCKITVKPKCMNVPVSNNRRSSGRRSTLESSDGSLYVSALSEVLDEVTLSSPPQKLEQLPKPDINIDEEYAEDPYQCATYAYDIFEYLKSREPHFKIKEYMEIQTNLTQHIRAILVDWMVEIQENFELNHETLYLGVKLVDAYLSKIKVNKSSLQLVGATAMFIAAKYDERIPPAIDDFLYICDGAYKRKDVTKMEVNILKVINFELGFPLSYRFLRRYARCAKVPMPLLTLARFVLEYTLMDYSTVFFSDSKMAAAALYISFKMKKEKEWDNTLIYFSGYKVRDFIEVAHALNNSLHQRPRPSLTTVRNKYSHKIFHEVAKIPLVGNEDL